MLSGEVGRKLVHVGIGAIALSLAVLTWQQAALCALVALVHNVFLLPRYGGRAIFRGEARARGVDFGIAVYPASVLSLILLFRDHLEIAAVGWIFMAVGDGMAGAVGGLLGKSTGKLPWNPDKSWAGLLAFVAAGVPAATFVHAVVSGEPQTARVVIALLVVGAIVAILESLPIGIDDNLLVPLSGGALAWCALFLVDPATLAAAGTEMLARLPWALAVNLTLGAAAYAARSVDVSGLVHGVLLGTALWVCGGFAAFSMLLLFFVLGTGATKIGYRIKLAEGTAQEKGGRRGARNAWANTGAGVLFAFLGAASGDPVYLLAVAAAFATAASDTLGSEIGQAFGRRTFLITTFRPVPRGTDGAVSLEGTLAGIAGSAVVGAAAFAQGAIDARGIGIVVVAAFFGTTLESYLGAWLERAKKIDNEAQNFINTLAGGLAAIVIFGWLGGR